MDKLTNRFYKQYDYTSRYSPFPNYYNVSTGKHVAGITSYLSDTTPYTLHVVKRGDTFDSLALQYYNNPTLYWIICSFNRISDPYRALEENEKLKIPTISNIVFESDERRS